MRLGFTSDGVTVNAATERLVLWHGDFRLEIVADDDGRLQLRQLDTMKLLVKPAASNAIELRASKY